MEAAPQDNGWTSSEALFYGLVDNALYNNWVSGAVGGRRPLTPLDGAAMLLGHRKEGALVVL